MADEWINEIQYTNSMEKLFSLERKGNFEDIALNKISQAQKDKYYWFHLYEVPEVVKFIKTENRMPVSRGWGQKGW